jgi:hypothetical protein
MAAVRLGLVGCGDDDESEAASLERRLAAAYDKLNRNYCGAVFECAPMVAEDYGYDTEESCLAERTQEYSVESEYFDAYVTECDRALVAFYECYAREVGCYEYDDSSAYSPGDSEASSSRVIVGLSGRCEEQYDAYYQACFVAVLGPNVDGMNEP